MAYFGGDNLCLAVGLLLLLPSHPLNNIQAPALIIGIIADAIPLLGLIVVVWARTVWCAEPEFIGRLVIRGIQWF